MGDSGRGAAWLARLLGVQEVPSSNLGGPTKAPFVITFPPSRAQFRHDCGETVNEMPRPGLGPAVQLEHLGIALPKHLCHHVIGHAGRTPPKSTARHGCTPNFARTLRPDRSRSAR